VKYDYALVTVPQGEKEVAEFDWDRLFPSKKPNSGKFTFSVIDECTGIVGKLVTRNAFIHGQIDGLVFAEHVTVEKTATVKGVIFCRTLNIIGSVNAHIICDSVIVRDGATLSSVLKYRTMKIEEGGSVAGRFERRILIDQSAEASARRDFPTPHFKAAMRE
jgi:cytoskeletal protein CcmA (bactofilin family)